MSYSQAVRTSIAAQDPVTPCCRIALLVALLAFAGRTTAESYCLEVENAAVARQAFRVAKAMGDSAPRLVHSSHPYQVALTMVPPLLAEAIHSAKLERTKFLRRTCCRRTWLKGAFLACGSLTRPEHGYHLEFSASGNLVLIIQDLLLKEGIRARRDERRSYIKAAEDIVAFLSLIGAVAIRLTYEQVLMGRDLKNQVQRAVNCDTANLDRTVEA
ncbi:MAG: DNA-binding protein WhiA, partial [Cyanobacteria bacterium NC_groundwater_1444_Ag_S-0.65um_54_12]|nr:DNA-binding protein WhiA [Cyanobacteria bacterium NC_groundwater_1444_Ag_S-0.65um_54_12]